MAVEVQFIHKYENTKMEMGSTFSIFFDPEAETKEYLSTKKEGTTKVKSIKGVKGGENQWMSSVLAGKPNTRGPRANLFTELKNVQFNEFMSHLDTKEFWSYNGS